MRWLTGKKHMASKPDDLRLLPRLPAKQRGESRHHTGVLLTAAAHAHPHTIPIHSSDR